jgi:hypothetical protein
MIFIYPDARSLSISAHSKKYRFETAALLAGILSRARSFIYNTLRPKALKMILHEHKKGQRC